MLLRGGSQMLAAASPGASVSAATAAAIEQTAADLGLTKLPPGKRASAPVAPLPAAPKGAGGQQATFGQSSSKNYRKTFFEANPDTEGKVVVHHAVEQQTLTRYPDVVTESEIHSLENLRGIPKEMNSDVHLSKIRKGWNRFYRQNPNPTKQQILDEATRIDIEFGDAFNPCRGSKCP
jgi:hypothetical protein